MWFQQDVSCHVSVLQRYDTTRYEAYVVNQIDAIEALLGGVLSNTDEQTFDLVGLKRSAIMIEKRGKAQKQ
jgi:hypothetical protein